MLRYLVMRDNFIKRLYHQRTGYWKPDGEGLEAVARGSGPARSICSPEDERTPSSPRRARFSTGAITCSPCKLVDLGLLTPSGQPGAAELRRRALDGLRARHQQLNPFKFIIYSEWAGADLRPIE